MANTRVAKQERNTEPTTPELTRGRTTFSPRVDIFETEDELVLLADVPGVVAEDVDIKFENGQLTLHAHCAPRQEGAEHLLCEYGVGDFYRVFSVGESIDASKIAAELRAGVLTLHLPKSEATKPRRIAVRG